MLVCRCKVTKHASLKMWNTISDTRKKAFKKKKNRKNEKIFYLQQTELFRDKKNYAHHNLKLQQWISSKIPGQNEEQRSFDVQQTGDCRHTSNLKRCCITSTSLDFPSSTTSFLCSAKVFLSSAACFESFDCEVLSTESYKLKIWQMLHKKQSSWRFFGERTTRTIFP